ncbi:perlucin-like protein [Argopecten irradians]|uniref:perlucin-like protein n=1 Tax=Argopecten irradians TaxID=31199 RepID=UPI00371B5BF9
MEIALILLGAVLCFLRVEAQCRDGWLTFHNNCYLFSRDKASWGESAAICNVFHSHLAIIESAEENSFLKSELDHLHGGSSSAAYWLDGSDIEVEDIWRWSSTGQKITYLNWAANQPNNGHESNCMCLYGGLSFNMADEHCSTSYNYICEISADDAGEILG